MNLGIDHVLIAVADLDEAISTYQNLGFEAFYGGEHPNHGTHNALVPISGGFYLEFIAVKDPNLANQFPHTRRILGALERENRYIQWALDTPDLDQAVSAIRAQGIEIHDSIPGARKRSDGVDVAWRTAHFEDPRLPFIIQDLTPREIRIAEPNSGIGQQIRLKSIALGAKDANDPSEIFARILGLESSSSLTAGRGSIEIQESNSDQILKVIYKQVEPSGEGPKLEFQEIPLGADFEIVNG